MNWFHGPEREWNKKPIWSLTPVFTFVLACFTQRALNSPKQSTLKNYQTTNLWKLIYSLEHGAKLQPFPKLGTNLLDLFQNNVILLIYVNFNSAESRKMPVFSPKTNAIMTGWKCLFSVVSSFGKSYFSGIKFGACEAWFFVTQKRQRVLVCCSVGSNLVHGKSSKCRLDRSQGQCACF